MAFIRLHPWHSYVQGYLSHWESYLLCCVAQRYDTVMTTLSERLGPIMWMCIALAQIRVRYSWNLHLWDFILRTNYTLSGVIACFWSFGRELFSFRMRYDVYIRKVYDFTSPPRGFQQNLCLVPSWALRHSWLGNHKNANWRLQIHVRLLATGTLACI